MSKNQIIIVGVIVVGVLLAFAYGNLNNSKTDDGYLLSVPNLNFEIAFPAEPQFNRTDGEDFTRYSWFYIDNSPDGRVGLFVQAENNLYAYNKSQEEFIEETARIYVGVVSRMEKDPNASAIDYEISGVYSDTSRETETIVGRIVDVEGWTFNITNQFENENRYPGFISSFKKI
ncbi:hypothetical protein A3I40_02575 [Candidatus Uhrbacteria bacterium RIFCSPLOWO2_02_FULL_48_12]|uniref:Uncharacterized protein n=1 Tax=Candidatus Uhrbacteria bacterium RIFCSPLOWO2_02_FULL_48_12 TaxID=1802407 RepID=A0A1F7VAK0_9BACT|nr:MAG: hypothetical protein A3I40_02575 [Candidatus Uhrbacteria bacterium RIFCSPLOWO2_02_FULL_48_12]